MAAEEQRFRDSDRSVLREPQAKGPVRGPMAEAAERRRGRLVRSRWNCPLPETVWLEQRAEWPGDKEARVSRWVSEARPEPRLSNP